jgi:hypothetical protein
MPALAGQSYVSPEQGGNMAAPKVFVSSTCFDLGEIRDSIRTFIRAFGFDPVLSEYGDVFYHPDLHTHEACIHEISNCQLFLLIIGGRFGGSYVYEKDKSITNAEYEAAVTNRIPIFTYVKKSVLENHQLYQDNKDKPFIKEITFPAIEKQEDAISIFEFINRVRKASLNNGYESFEFAKEIEEHLRKQWAGMFFEYIRTRELKEQFANTNQLLAALEASSEKLEAITKGIYQNVDQENYVKNIGRIEIEAKARYFVSRIFSEVRSGGIHVKSPEEIDYVYTIDPAGLDWYEYLVDVGLFEVKEDNDDELMLCLPDDKIENHSERDFGYIGISVKKKMSNLFQRRLKDAFDNGFKRLSFEERKKILEPYVFISSEED